MWYLLTAELIIKSFQVIANAALVATKLRRNYAIKQPIKQPMQPLNLYFLDHTRALRLVVQSYKTHNAELSAYKGN